MFGNNGGKRPPQSPSFGGQPFPSVTSHNQSGGITAGIVNLGPQRRDLDLPDFDGLKAQIQRELPRDKPLTVTAVMGDGEAAEFAVQIHKYLTAEGFKMTETGISQGMFSTPPINLQVQDKGAGGLNFVVGHHRP